MKRPNKKSSYKKIDNGHKVVFTTKGYGETRKEFIKRVRKELKVMLTY